MQMSAHLRQAKTSVLARQEWQERAFSAGVSPAECGVADSTVTLEGSPQFQSGVLGVFSDSTLATHSGQMP